MKLVNLGQCWKRCILSKRQLLQNVFIFFSLWWFYMYIYLYIFFLLYSAPDILLKHYLQWDSHQAKIEPDFPMFVNLQCEETNPVVPHFQWENTVHPFSAGNGGRVNLITRFGPFIFWIYLPEKAAFPPASFFRPWNTPLSCMSLCI